MRYITTSLLFFLILFIHQNMFGQASFIVDYRGTVNELKEAISRQSDFILEDHIPQTSIYLLKANTDRIDNQVAIKNLGLNFFSISVNKPVEVRSKEPDDPYFKDQWQYNIIHAAEAWDFGTGGITCRGDQIVLAVLDSGFDPVHEDIAPNLWTNKGEIPGDGIDNDNNGYVDDVKGLNTGTNTDNHDLDSHGLKVSGILGARGNNGKGVSGVNWTSQIMLVSYIPSDFYVLKGLKYVLDQRRKYNQTNGKEGAFVVSVNNSFGISNEFPKDGHEMWCNMYDSLGMEGIISVGATTNSNKDVDLVGDIPSTCTSEYLIVVTNTDKNDKKITNAGFGKKSVDIGSPGEGTFTVGLNNGYTTFSGTSAATPHVASAVGLLYSTACCSLIDQAKTNPAATAIKVRDYILNGASVNNSLKGITTKEARLDLMGAVTKLVAECGNVTGPNNVDNIKLLNFGNQISVKFTGKEYKTYSYSVYTILGVEINSGKFDFETYGSNEFEIDLSVLPPGAYFITIWDEKSPVSKQFIKLK